MNRPTIELIPLRPAVRADAPDTLDVVLKITPPPVELNASRPPLNLGLVLDRSGSMATEKKIDHAREAAIFAVQQLLPSDRVSVTIFDDQVQTIVPNVFAENKAQIIDVIRRIRTGNSTALHNGWKEGAAQVRQNLIAGGLNRVLLLSDGMANVGEKNTDVIAADVNRLAREAVSTTTMGLGDHFNEDLMEAMAKAGDGNYFYIEGSQQLPDVFQTELQGLIATIGNTVQLGIDPQVGVTVADILNDLDTMPDGQLKLSNLICGMPILVTVRLSVSPIAREESLCVFRLTWTHPNEALPQVMSVTLSLPSVAGHLWESLAANVEVEEQVVLLLVARYKKEATLCLDRGDREGAVRSLTAAKQILAGAPATPEVQKEIEAVAQIEAYLANGEWMKFQKQAKYQTNNRRLSNWR